MQGDEENGWTDFIDPLWLQFFERILDTSDFQSRLIITSQDTPSQLKNKLSDKELYFLKGLNHLERLELFAARGIDVDSESTLPCLESIGNVYEGHPLALWLTAAEILAQPFFGDVLAYWEEYGEIIKKAEERYKLLENEKEYKSLYLNQILREEVKKRVETSLMRLRNDFPKAYFLLAKASAYRRAVERKAWFRVIEKYGFKEDDLDPLLEQLFERCLVEEEPFIEDRTLLKQHSLIRNALVNRLEKAEEQKKLRDKVRKNTPKLTDT